MAVAHAKRAAGSFFAPFVKWITFAGRRTGQDAVHRTAQADFNVRGWQGRLRYTALAALFFWGRRCPALRARERQSGRAYNCRKIRGNSGSDCLNDGPSKPPARLRKTKMKNFISRR